MWGTTWWLQWSQKIGGNPWIAAIPAPHAVASTNPKKILNLFISTATTKKCGAPRGGCSESKKMLGIH